MLEEKTAVPCFGVVPFSQAKIDDEDSLAPELERTAVHKAVDIAVIRLPRIANFTDFDPLEQHPALGVRYVDSVRTLGQPDLIILPGTKNTMGDLEWLRKCGLEAYIIRLFARGVPVLGICGGYQMLGQSIADPEYTEHGGEMRGMGLLPVNTVFIADKVRTRVRGTVREPFGGAQIDGYEIHMGRTERNGAEPFCVLSDGKEDGIVNGSCFGTYLHGLFDSGELTARLAEYLLKRKGLKAEAVEPETHHDFLERQLDLLADEVRGNLDIAAIYRAMETYEKEDA